MKVTNTEHFFVGISYTKFHPNFMKNIENIREKFNYTLIKNIPYTASIVIQVLYDQQRYVEIICTNFYPNWMQNVQNAVKI